MFLSTNTKTFKSICLILSCSILLMSFHTTKYVSLQDEYNTLFKGKTYVEIVEEVGPPDRVVPDGQGGEIMVYENKSLSGIYGGSATGGSISLSESKKQTSFFVDENKVCYKVKTDDVRVVGDNYKPSPFTFLDFCAIILVGLIVAVPVVYMLSAESD